MGIKNKIVRYQINWQKEKFINYIISILIIVFVLLFYFLENYRLWIGGIFFIFMALIIFLQKKKDYYSIISTSGLLGLGIFSIVINYSIVWAFLILISMLIFNIILITVKKTLMGWFFSFIYFLASLQMVSPLRSDIFNQIFQKNISISIIVVSFLGIVFVFSSIYLFLKYSFSYFSKIKVMDKIFQLKKQNNGYYVIALTLIIVILIGGITAVRESYINYYPIKVDFGVSGLLRGDYPICNSATNKIYPVDGDRISCVANISLHNGTLKEFKIYVKDKEKLNWIEYDEDLYPSYHDSPFKNNHFNNFYFIISKKYEDYRIYMSSSQETSINYYWAELDINPLTKVEYNEKIERRIGLIITIFSILLFSVFSAIKNIKDLLDN